MMRLIFKTSSVTPDFFFYVFNIILSFSTDGISKKERGLVTRQRSRRRAGDGVALKSQGGEERSDDGLRADPNSPLNQKRIPASKSKKGIQPPYQHPNSPLNQKRIPANKFKKNINQQIQKVYQPTESAKRRGGLR